MDCRGLSREEVLRNKQKRVQTTLFFFFLQATLKVSREGQGSGAIYKHENS